MLLPSVCSIQKINFRTARWVLVIEKEVWWPGAQAARFQTYHSQLKATFRTLAASQYSRTSQAGHGILLTVCSGTPNQRAKLIAWLDRQKGSLIWPQGASYPPSTHFGQNWNCLPWLTLTLTGLLSCGHTSTGANAWIMRRMPQPRGSNGSASTATTSYRTHLQNLKRPATAARVSGVKKLLARSLWRILLLVSTPESSMPLKPA
jgi:hypothetical protein